MPWSYLPAQLPDYCMTCDCKEEVQSVSFLHGKWTYPVRPRTKSTKIMLFNLQCLPQKVLQTEVQKYVDRYDAVCSSFTFIEFNIFPPAPVIISTKCQTESKDGYDFYSHQPMPDAICIPMALQEHITFFTMHQRFKDVVALIKLPQ